MAVLVLPTVTSKSGKSNKHHVTRRSGILIYKLKCMVRYRANMSERQNLQNSLNRSYIWMSVNAVTKFQLDICPFE